MEVALSIFFLSFGRDCNDIGAPDTHFSPCLMTATSLFHLTHPVNYNLIFCSDLATIFLPPTSDACSVMQFNFSQRNK